MNRTLLALALSLIAHHAAAMAFCALRDPNQQIYAFFPQADGFRSLLEEVDQSVREGVRERLPFTLHHRELGQHSLYVVLQDALPMGVVHVRSESSQYGLVEIAWALDLQLRIIDFSFQRCREAGCRTVESAQFKDALRGRGIDELKTYIDADGAIGAAAPDLLQQDSGLVAAVLRSALKTIAVTELVWGRTLARL